MNRRVRALVLWLALGGLVAGIAYIESRPEAPEEDPEVHLRLIGLREADLGQVDLFYKGRLATILRSPGGLWLLHDSSHSHSGGLPAAPGDGGNAGSPAQSAPAVPSHLHTEPDPVQAARIAQRIDLIARMKADRILDPPPKLSSYGLDNPPIAILLYARTPDNSPAPKPVAALYVGALLPTNQSYYAQLMGQRQVAVITLYWIDALVEIAFGVDPNPNKKQLPPGSLK